MRGQRDSLNRGISGDDTSNVGSEGEDRAPCHPEAAVLFPEYSWAEALVTRGAFHEVVIDGERVVGVADTWSPAYQRAGQ
ncbi:hypothetical protein BOH66_04240 [Microbacterium aurum]|uniref:Uncharacterized protein n=1 Tax=Microbacterium aurum TaxID=36805 RepID=A0A1P8U646_9MICO|nr:hypothetical protein [Microbacterium aurum]APZ33569.1 hypothetical protein BOH66_04240 [Microbacterium aurum]MBM7827261.1 hypothetical protein [Microbacterium aurum]